MRLLIGTAIVFFGTLIAAAFVALGAPVVTDFVAAHQGAARSTAARDNAQVARQVDTAPGRH